MGWCRECDPLIRSNGSRILEEAVMISPLDISTSALVAQRVRLNTISGNIANMSTLKNEEGEAKPYQPRFVIFKTDEQQAEGGAAGVKIERVEIKQSEPKYRYQPDHPLAVTEGKWKGYVAYPDIDMNEQFVDALEASRAYEANVGVIEVTKGMSRQTLSILA
jgi:flagellar basal-body rod protein FlgC